MNNLHFLLSLLKTKQVILHNNNLIAFYSLLKVLTICLRAKTIASYASTNYTISCYFNNCMLRKEYEF